MKLKLYGELGRNGDELKVKERMKSD